MPYFVDMTIVEWLNSDRNFSIGVALYEAYGTDNLLKQMFDQGHSHLRAKRLYSALLELKDLSKPKTDIAEATPTPVVVNAVHMPEQSVPEGQDPYRKEWLPIYQEMALLRHRLEDASNDVERGEMAFKILDLERQCMSIWTRRDYFLKYGREIEPETTEEVVTDRGAMHRRIANLRSYVVKYSKPSERPEWPVRLAKFKKELEELEERYKNAL